MGTFIFGFGTAIIFVRSVLEVTNDSPQCKITLLVRIGGCNLIVEAFTIYAASALAAGVFLRSMVATFLPLVGPTLNEKVGYGW
jgi:hypothetical protein